MEGYMERSKLNKIIGSNIRFLRKNTRISFRNKQRVLNQTDFGKFVGMIPQSISKFEIGKNELGIAQVYRISKFFGVSIDNLFKEDLMNQKYEKLIIKVENNNYTLISKLENA
jgi:transcriptional regulator with XRE-family HTH domain